MPFISSNTPVDPASWVATRASNLAQSVSVQQTAAGPSASAAAGQTQTNKMKDVGQQFEALYLRQMLEEWMPKDSESLFGEGTAGSVWRSMLVDKMATTLSKSGAVGIAQMIFKSELAASQGK